jgi:hypothetical protein
VDYVERERLDHEAGDPIAVHRVALFCVWNSQPLPKWAAGAVEAIIKKDMDDRPNRGKGNAAPAVAAFDWDRNSGWFEAIEFHKAMPRQYAGYRDEPFKPLGLKGAIEYLATVLPVHSEKALSRVYEREKARRRIPTEPR